MATLKPRARRNTTATRPAPQGLSAGDVQQVAPNQANKQQAPQGAFGEDLARGIQALGISGMRRNQAEQIQQNQSLEQQLRQTKALDDQLSEREAALLKAEQDRMEQDDNLSITRTLGEYKLRVRDRFNQLKEEGKLSFGNSDALIGEQMAEIGEQQLGAMEFNNPLNKEKLREKIESEKLNFALEFQGEIAKARNTEISRNLESSIQELRQTAPAGASLDDYRASVVGRVNEHDEAPLEIKQMFLESEMEDFTKSKISQSILLGNLEEAEGTLLESIEKGYVGSTDFIRKQRDAIQNAKNIKTAADIKEQAETQLWEKRFGKPASQFTQAEQRIRFGSDVAEIDKNDPVAMTNAMINQFEIINKRKPTEEELAEIGEDVRNSILGGEESGFTLGPGQTRFSSSGKEVAKVDPKKELTPEEEGRDAAAKKIAEKKALLAAFPEDNKKSEFVGETGELKREVSAEIRKQVASQFQGSIDDSGRVVGVSQAALGEMTRFSAAVANKLQTGQAKSIEEAVSDTREEFRKNNPELFGRDTTTSQEWQKIKKQILSPKEVDEEPQPPSESISDADAESGFEDTRSYLARLKASSDSGEIDLGDATGIISAMSNAWNTVAGQINHESFNPKVASARLKLSLLARRIIQVNALNPRYPIAEQEMLLDIFGNPSVWDSPKEVEAKIRDFREIVKERINDFELQMKIQAPGKNFDQSRFDAFKQAQTYTKVLRMLNRFKVGTIDGVDEPELPETINKETVSGMDRKKTSRLVTQLGPEGLRSLDEETRIEIGNKLGVQLQPTVTPVEQPKEKPKAQSKKQTKKGKPVKELKKGESSALDLNNLSESELRERQTAAQESGDLELAEQIGKLLGENFKEESE